MAGVLVSDVLAYKSNSAGFKRGKVCHIFLAVVVYMACSNR